MAKNTHQDQLPSTPTDDVYTQIDPFERNSPIPGPGSIKGIQRRPLLLHLLHLIHSPASPSYHPEYSAHECLVIFLAEFLGSAVLLFNGCLCTVQFTESPDSLVGSLGFGFTVAMVICMVGPHSGAHVNPSVTVCGILLGNLPPWVSGLNRNLYFIPTDPVLLLRSSWSTCQPNYWEP